MYNNYEDSDMIEINKNQLARITQAKQTLIDNIRYWLPSKEEDED